MSKLNPLSTGLRSGSVWQILGAYLFGSWIALQVTETVSSLIGLPLWVGKGVLVLLGVGLPVILFTAIVQASRKGASADAPEVGAGSAPAPPSPTAPAGDAPRDGRRLFTWRNALVAGVVAFALLGLTVAGYVAMRELGIGPAGTLVAKGVLEERDLILLADFENDTDDPRLGDVVTEALRVDMSESETVQLADPSFVRGALRRAQRPIDAGLDADLAREIATREGIEAVLTGEIAAVGGGFQLVADVVAASDGAVLVSRRETASDESELLGAIDRLSKGLRERVGEPLRSIRAAEPLEQVTTSDLEALRLYSEAVRDIESGRDEESGLALLEEAVTRDTAFAAAYRKIGVVLGNRNEDRGRQLEVLARAYAHRDRLTEVERYLTEASYWAARGDRNRSRQALERLVESSPDSRAHNNLGLEYGAIGDDEAALEHYQHAIALDSASGIPYGNIVPTLFALGRVDEARQALDVYDARFQDSPLTPQYRFQMAAAQGEWDEARAHLERQLEAARGNAFAEAGARFNLGTLDAVQGKFSDARVQFDRREQLQNLEANSVLALQGASFTAGIVVVAGDTAAAVAQLDETLVRFPLDSVPELDRPYLQLSAVYAYLGQPDKAEALLAEYQRVVPPELRMNTETGIAANRSAIAMARGNYDEALRQSALADDPGGCRLCQMRGRAMIFDAAGVPDSAIALYTASLEEPYMSSVYPDAVTLARTLERLARLHDEADDLRSAQLYYARFVELWADADPVVQPRVEAAQARIDAIQREIG